MAAERVERDQAADVQRPRAADATWSSPLIAFRLTSTSGVTMRSFTMPSRSLPPPANGGDLPSRARLLDQRHRLLEDREDWHWQRFSCQHLPSAENLVARDRQFLHAVTQWR